MARFSGREVILVGEVEAYGLEYGGGEGIGRLDAIASRPKELPVSLSPHRHDQKIYDCRCRNTMFRRVIAMSGRFDAQHFEPKVATNHIRRSACVPFV